MIEVRQTAQFNSWFGRLRDVQAKARISVRIRRVSLGNLGDVKPVGEGSANFASIMAPATESISSSAEPSS